MKRLAYFTHLQMISLFICLQQPSSNFDDSGFFSIQVIQKAVLLWGLELLPYNSDDVIAVESRRDPTYVHSQYKTR